MLKSEAELAAERSALLTSGQVVASTQPVYVVAEHERVLASGSATKKSEPAEGAIRSDVLLVNDAVLSVDELLYPLREKIAEANQSSTPRARLEKLQRLLRVQLQQDVGSMLVYAQAMSRLSEPQKKSVEESVQRVLRERVARDYGGSFARLNRELLEHGLSEKQYRARLERELVVRQYTRELLQPRIALRRDELIDYYRANPEQFAAAETRELLLIEAPFARFLPQNLAWTQATPQQQARAKLDAVRHIRAAHEALRSRPFDEVAREFSRGPHADQGGLFGEIGKPLQPPYDAASKLVFGFSERQFSEPLEIAAGWILVGCGRITPAVKRSFAEAQDQIRDELTERRFTTLSNEYVVKLAQSATITSLDGFLTTALERAAARAAPQSSR